MARYKQPKIEDEGVPSYLARTADQHDGKVYTELEHMLNLHISIEGIRAMFGGVHRRTLLKWIAIDPNLSDIYERVYKKKGAEHV